MIGGVYVNPFRSRASEQQRDLPNFVRTFGPGILDLLPDALWDRLFVIRSAPGGGKTSLLRLLTFESLAEVHRRRRDFEPLVERLVHLGALSEHGPRYVGVHLNLNREYRSLLDVGTGPEVGERLFLRLLDARILGAVMRAALASRGMRFPQDVAKLEFRMNSELDDARELGERLGGPDGLGVYEVARRSEAEIVSLLESLSPIEWGNLTGHSSLYSLRLLSASDIVVDGKSIVGRPLLLFDDGHELSFGQRRALLDQLAARDLSIPRWYAERLEALAPDELVGKTEGRDYVSLDLEASARSQSALRGRSRTRAFERFLIDVADLRASRAITRLTDLDAAFSDLIGVEDDSKSGSSTDAIIEELLRRVHARASQSRRYEGLIDQAFRLSGFRTAVRLREIEILVERESARPMAPIFDLEPTDNEVKSTSSATVREAAEIFLAREFELPYYAGVTTMARLASQNVDQYLTLCGDLFEQVITSSALRRQSHLTPRRQQQIVVAASDRLWRDISRRVPHGRDVQRLLWGIAGYAERETYRPTAPYPPGVTGVALGSRERAVLFDERLRTVVPGATELHRALANAVAFNLLSAESDHSSKGDNVTVFYLNRLLLPRIWLPLGRGGFRERTVRELAAYLQSPPDVSHGDQSELSSLLT